MSLTFAVGTFLVGATDFGVDGSASFVRLVPDHEAGPPREIHLLVAGDPVVFERLNAAGDALAAGSPRPPRFSLGPMPCEFRPQNGHFHLRFGEEEAGSASFFLGQVRPVKGLVISLSRRLLEVRFRTRVDVDLAVRADLAL